jgi:Glucanosyltransferase
MIPLASTVALNPVEIKGFKLFDSESGNEFVVRGIDYYPRPNHGDLNHNSLDLFTEEHRHIWERDVLYLQELGVNAIRLYAVDPDENHDAFM